VGRRRRVRVWRTQCQSSRDHRTCSGRRARAADRAVRHRAKRRSGPRSGRRRPRQRNRQLCRSQRRRHVLGKDHGNDLFELPGSPEASGVQEQASKKKELYTLEDIERRRRYLMKALAKFDVLTEPLESHRTDFAA